MECAWPVALRPRLATGLPLSEGGRAIRLSYDVPKSAGAGRSQDRCQSKERGEFSQRLSAALISRVDAKTVVFSGMKRRRSYTAGRDDLTCWMCHAGGPRAKLDQEPRRNGGVH